MSRVLHRSLLPKEPVILRLAVMLTCIMCYLDVRALGWDYSDESAPFWMKIHPSFYLFGFVAAAALASNQRARKALFSWQYGPFAVMVLVLLVKAVAVTSSGSNPTGTVGTVLMSFVTPVFFLVALTTLTYADRDRVGRYIRALMVVGSIVALIEAVTQRNLIAFSDSYGAFRASGLLGHPLSGAAATGQMLVYLLTTNRRRGRITLVLPEIGLHMLAMFAYGGRTALVVVPLVVAMGALLPMKGAGILKRFAQRAGVALLLAFALLLTQVNVAFVQTALNRFQTDTISTNTRFAAIQMLGRLNLHDLLNGSSLAQQLALMRAYHTPIAIEVSWIALIFQFGALFTIPLAITMIWALFSTARKLDRSANIMVLYFLVISASSVSFGHKSVEVTRFLIGVTTLCLPLLQIQRNRRRPVQRYGPDATPRPAIHSPHARAGSA